MVHDRLAGSGADLVGPPPQHFVLEFLRGPKPGELGQQRVVPRPQVIVPGAGDRDQRLGSTRARSWA